METKKAMSQTMKKYLLTLVLVFAMLMLVTPVYATSGMDNFKASENYSDSTYKDVKPLWYETYVKTCFEYKLMNGNGGLFDPNGKLSVAEAIVMADRVHQIYNTGSSTLKNGTPWYQTYVDYATSNGIIKSGDFPDYNAKITRAQMSYIFANALPKSELAAKNSISSLPDVNKTDKYGSYIFDLYNAGVLTGSDAYGTFNPDSEIARYEAAAIIARVAIPSQRQDVALLEKYINGVFGISLPQGSIYENQDENNYLYKTSDSLTAVTVTKNTQSSLNGMAITFMDMGYIGNILTSSLSEQGITTSSIQKSSTVSFGNVKAYKYELTIREDGVNMSAYAYMLIDKSTLYMVNFVSVNQSLLKRIDSLFTVNGCYSK
jgi:hypothetical protein